MVVKKVKYIVLFAVLAVLIVVVGVVVWIDHIAKVGVERGATYALGVETTLDSMDVGIFGGSVEMTNLDVANPEGFNAPKFLQLGTGRVAVSLGSLMEDTVVVPELTLDNVNMSIERKGKKTNVDAIIANLQKLQSGDSTPQQPRSEAKKFVINEVAVTNVNVSVNMLPIGGELTTVPVKIERIELRDVGSGKDQGVVLAELTGIVVQAILTAVVDKAGTVLPADILADLTHGLDQIDGLGGDAIKVVGDVTAGAGKVLEQAGQATQELNQALNEGSQKLRKNLDEAGKELQKGLGGLVKPKKDDDD